MYAPVLAFLPLDSAVGVEVAVVVGALAFHITRVEFVVQLSNVAVAQDTRARRVSAFLVNRFPSHLVDHVQIKKRGLVVAEYTRAPN